MLVFISLLMSTVEVPYAVSKTADGGFAITAPRIAADQAAAFKEALQREVTQRCGVRPILWGKFTFKEQVAGPGGAPVAERALTDFRQEFRCGDVSASNVIEVAADWRPSAIDETDARAFATNYFADRDAGRAAEAYARYDPAAMGTRESYDQRQAEFVATAGAASGRTIDKLTWYVNPDSAPKRGAYVAVDYHGRFAQLDTMCGYIVLYRLGPGRYAITREETNILSLAAISGKSQQNVDRMRGALQCRG